MTSTHSSALPGSLRSSSHSPSVSACSSSGSTSFPGFSSSAEAPDAHVTELVAALVGYEQLLQRLFSEGGRLATAVVAAQARENLSPLAGHQILSAISNAQLSVTGAIGHMAEGHRQLEVMAAKLGIDPEAFGDVIKRPSARASGPIGLAA